MKTLLPLSKCCNYLFLEKNVALFGKENTLLPFTFKCLLIFLSNYLSACKGKSFQKSSGCFFPRVIALRTLQLVPFSLQGLIYYDGGL